MLNSTVNATCINVLFMPERIAGMHESLRRLYQAAKAATAHLPAAQRIEEDSPSSLARAMNVSPAVMTNWKARGISFEGAVNAEGLFGCSAWWLMNGELPVGWRGRGEIGPLSDELTDRLARDGALALMWENAIRGALKMAPVAFIGKRRAA